MSKQPLIQSTRQFVEILKKENELLEIEEIVDPHLELAEIQRRVVAQKGKAILFKNVKGSQFSVATNLFGSQKRLDLAFSNRPVELIQELTATFETIFPPTLQKIWNAKNLGWSLLKMGTKQVSNGPVLEHEIPDANLKKLPQIQCWNEDGGPFITLPLVYTQHPNNGKSNLGMYRIQMFNENECGMHIQIHRGGGFHYYEAEKLNQSLPAHIYIGGPPALIIAAISPLPEDVPEILLASLLMGKRLKKLSRNDISPLPILAQADFCIVGKIPPHKRKPEGPFGDHYGYYSLKHDFPFMQIDRIFHRKDAIYPATIVGRPPQEDHYIACYLQELLKPLIHMVMPQVKHVWAYEESGVHSLAGAIVKDRYPREALTTALRILGEGQLSLSKVLMVTDKDCDLKDFKTFLTLMLERIDFSKDLFILSNISQDTLDYTGPKLNEGSKAIFLGLGDPIRKLPKEFSGTFKNNIFKDPHVFCPGAICISGPSWDRLCDSATVRLGEDSPRKVAESQSRKVAESLCQEPCLANWPMIFLVDNAKEAAKSPEDFLWHIFTRFEPAADIYAKKTHVNRYHIGLEPPIVIDCRMKPWYPKVLESDDKIVQKVEPVLQKYGL